MLIRLLWRFMRHVSLRLGWKALRLWVIPGMGALRAYKKRLSRGELFPPFLFFALTDVCNLRCRGCWITSCETSRELSLQQVRTCISAGKAHKSRFFTLLGGEPFLYPHLWEILEENPDCYFQIITNGTFLDEITATRLRKLGNVTVLVSLDGGMAVNDSRRGEGVYHSVIHGLESLHKNGILYGVATTVTSANLAEVTSDAYVEDLMKRGAMYLWYYIYRPVGASPTAELALSRDKILELRRQILRLRRCKAIIIIDTYWTSEGAAVCPAAQGLGFHIGPEGGVEPCPPLSYACENVMDHGGNLFKTINESVYLRDFQRFVRERTQGCVILEYPQELGHFLTSHHAQDRSGRENSVNELMSMEAKCSHHIPGEEIPENTWLYRFLKKSLFFGMGGYG